MNIPLQDGIVSLLCEMKKVMLVNYAKSYGLKISGTKREIARRIFDSKVTLTLNLMAPPNGIIAIGIALEHQS